MTLQVENLTYLLSDPPRGCSCAGEHKLSMSQMVRLWGWPANRAAEKPRWAPAWSFLKPPMKYIGGRVMLDGEELPIRDMERMNDFRFKKISIIPQYAMNAMNPTRKIGKMTAELLRSRNVDFKTILPELKERLDLVKLPEMC